VAHYADAFELIYAKKSDGTAIAKVFPEPGEQDIYKVQEANVKPQWKDIVEKKGPNGFYLREAKPEEIKTLQSQLSIQQPVVHDWEGNEDVKILRFDEEKLPKSLDATFLNKLKEAFKEPELYFRVYRRVAQEPKFQIVRKVDQTSGAVTYDEKETKMEANLIARNDPVQTGGGLHFKTLRDAGLKDNTEAQGQYASKLSVVQNVSASVVADQFFTSTLSTLAKNMQAAKSSAEMFSDQKLEREDKFSAKGLPYIPDVVVDDRPERSEALAATQATVLSLSILLILLIIAALFLMWVWSKNKYKRIMFYGPDGKGWVKKKDDTKKDEEEGDNGDPESGKQTDGVSEDVFESRNKPNWKSYFYPTQWKNIVFSSFYRRNSFIARKNPEKPEQSGSANPGETSETQTQDSSNVENEQSYFKLSEGLNPFASTAKGMEFYEVKEYDTDKKGYTLNNARKDKEWYKILGFSTKEPQTLPGTSTDADEAESTQPKDEGVPDEKTKQKVLKEWSLQMAVKDESESIYRPFDGKRALIFGMPSARSWGNLKKELLVCLSPQKDPLFYAVVFYGALFFGLYIIIQELKALLKKALKPVGSVVDSAVKFGTFGQVEVDSAEETSSVVSEGVAMFLVIFVMVFAAVMTLLFIMLGVSRLPDYFRRGILWTVGIPVLCGFLFFTAAIQVILTGGNTDQLMGWGITFGVLLLARIVLVVYRLGSQEGSFVGSKFKKLRKKLSKSKKPSETVKELPSDI